MLVDLELASHYYRDTVQYFPIKRSLPFIRNKRATLIHRVRKAEGIRPIHKERVHYAVHLWCGNTFTGEKEKFDLIGDVDSGDIVCQRCEERISELGMISADEICGRHVHVGGVKAKITCCGQ